MLGFERFVFILRIMAITLKNGRLKMRILIQSEKNFLILRLWDFLCIREDSQIDFARENVFSTFVEGGWGALHKNVSQVLAIIDFFKQRNYWKTVSVRKNIIGNITLSQTSRLSLDKFGIGNYIPDCPSAPFA